jgi:two-component system, OmpR family, sensor histidine kinase KdpD
MDEERRRPDPDELLARIQAEDRKQTRGAFRIFLGYAAGVGKTYAMLEAAHQRRSEGVDVVVACIDTHGRSETEALVADLELLPLRDAAYRGIVLREMDMDAVLERRPRLALVDELAHANAPGSRHPKRYHDVEELLQSGIDVYTTLNVQHIESLNDVVAQITGITVRETVPDGVIDAAEVELVDLTPEDLLQRLHDGKVYVPDQAAQAIRRFFRVGNLTALRELAMRRAAERVDGQMQAYMRSRAIPGPWPAKERVLVCVSPGPLADRLVRAGRRLAEQMNADWSAVYVETHEHARLSEAARARVSRALQLAEELGGTSVALPARSAAEAVLGYARRHNVTKLLVGKPVRPRWRDALRGSPVDKIIRDSRAIDVYVITGVAESDAADATAAEATQSPRADAQAWWRYALGVLLVAAATALGALLSPLFSAVNLVMFYLLAVVVAAIYLGRGPSVLCTVLAVLAFDYFMVPPRFTLAVSDTEYLLTFATLLMVSLVVSDLALRVRDQASAAERRANQNAELYALSRDLAVAENVDAIARAIGVRARHTVDRDTVLLLPDKAGHALHVHPPDSVSPPDDEVAVATWAYMHGQPAGRGTETLAGAVGRYIPLRASGRVVGVLGVMAPEATGRLGLDQRQLLEAFASQLAMAIERTLLAEQARQAEVLKTTERLQTALLNSISHDLRSPLVSITGALSALAADEAALDCETRHALVENAYGEAERLNRLVGNLVDMTCIEAGALRVKLTPCDVEDVVGAGMAPLADRLAGRQVLVDVAADLPLVPMDEVLMAQVVLNLVDNALKYSPAGAPVEIRACRDGDAARIEVADRGTGIPGDETQQVFDKLYRVRQPGKVGGMGLGLSICRGIVEAHGGSIAAHRREGGGTVIAVVLPLEAAVETTT